MQIAAPQLAAHLQRGLKPLYVLHGDEPLLQQEAADAIRAAAREQGYTERTVFVVSGAHFDWSAVLAAGNSLSLFADKQLVELRIPSGKPGKEGGQALQQLAEQAATQDSTLTLVLLPRLEGAAYKSAWFGALEAHGVTLRLDPIERAQLPQWIAQRLQVNQQRVAPGEAGQRTLQFMADRVEGNLLAAHQEIQKLALLHPAGELSFEQVESAVLNVARYDPFKWSDAVLLGQTERMHRMLEGLEAEGTAAVLVHWALSDDLRTLWRLKTATQAGKPLAMALREQRLWGPKEKKFERAVPRVSVAQTEQWVQAAHVLDGLCKGLKHPDWPANPWQALAHLAIQVSRTCGGKLAPNGA